MHEIENEKGANYIAFTYLKIVENKHIYLKDINESNTMFLFEYKFTRETIAHNRYQVTAFDGKFK